MNGMQLEVVIKTDDESVAEVALVQFPYEPGQSRYPGADWHPTMSLAKVFVDLGNATQLTAAQEQYLQRHGHGLDWRITPKP